MNKCVTIGFGFNPDWMNKWRKFFKPIVWRRRCKTSELRHSNENPSIQECDNVTTLNPIFTLDYYRSSGCLQEFKNKKTANFNFLALKVVTVACERWPLQEVKTFGSLHGKLVTGHLSYPRSIVSIGSFEHNYNLTATTSSTQD